MTPLATKVKGLRIAKGLGLTQFAQRVPMERSYLWQIEHGKDTNLGLKILLGLANTLDVRVDYLVDDSINETRSWEKVAADESLELFLKRNEISEEEKIRLRRISFKQTAPRSLREWEQFWNNLKTYSQPEPSTKPLRNRPRSRKNMDTSGPIAY